jgi:hypothetical protein
MHASFAPHLPFNVHALGHSELEGIGNKINTKQNNKLKNEY